MPFHGPGLVHKKPLLRMLVMLHVVPQVEWFRTHPCCGLRVGKSWEHKATCLGSTVGPELAGRKLPIRVASRACPRSQLRGTRETLLKGKCPRSHAGGGRHRGARERQPFLCYACGDPPASPFTKPETTPTNEGEVVMGASSSIDITKESKVWVQNLRGK